MVLQSVDGHLRLVRLIFCPFRQATFLLERVQAGQLPRSASYGAAPTRARAGQDHWCGLRVPLLPGALPLAHAPLRKLQYLLPPDWLWGLMPSLRWACRVHGAGRLTYQVATNFSSARR
jgi:hypothetical protein